MVAIYFNKRSFTFVLIAMFSIIFIGYAKYVKDHNERMNILEHSSTETAIMIKRSISSVKSEHIKCLATNIYHEAKSEPFMGQVAVARVVMNRIKHKFASDPCKVIYQKTYSEEKEKNICQFSWVCEGKKSPSVNSTAYKKAEYIAKRVILENSWSDSIPNNVLFFHSIHVSPMWNYQKIMTIGNHVFYSKPKKVTYTE